ncbi:MAG: M1 family metallopeptidase [Bacteroidetes bacterium]|nr:M1 family metallopeptidase [Bacteroidota bacterium]
MVKTILNIPVIICLSAIFSIAQENYNQEKSNITAEDYSAIPDQPAEPAKKFKKAIRYDPIHPPNTYRHPGNPHYWKNRPPFPGYWQQDVYYKIKADLNESTDIITADEEVIYWNNSPDTLRFVFFHLYQNAFQPGSYYEKLMDAYKEKADWGDYEDAGYGTGIDRITVNGKEVKTEQDNTILKVWLPEPLPQDDSALFNISFKSYFDEGGERRRMKMFDVYGYKHYDGVHWYPRIAVYDRKFGWETDQHLGHEFYGDFGTYDVALTLANNNIVDATGELLNREEVLPDSLRKKLDISNFKDNPLDSPPSVIVPFDSAIRKTWHFYAENVHDFAFTADPTYRIGEKVIELPSLSGEGRRGEVKCIALAQEPHAARWQNAADYTARIIKLYSEDIGMFVWHKMIVADARDGMEYPMLTLDGGLDPDYRGLFMHEIGHNWFYGQVANNETYRASLDEGFTTFLTVWAYEKLEGDTVIKTDPDSHREEKFYTRLFKKPDMVRDNRTYFNYLNYALRENNATLNTHSDDFGNGLNHGGGYRQVYQKTATMLFNLQYVLGDDLFLKAMQRYFEQWKLCHPYPEDFRNSIIHFTGTDLNWFFDEWLETTKTSDYSVGRVRRIDPDTTIKDSVIRSQNRYCITFKRNGEMQMPIDFTVVTKEGEKHNYHIPNGWYEKKTDAKILHRWIGWGKLNDAYKVHLSIPGKIHDVIIDPTHRLADIYMPDNNRRCRVKYYFDSRVFNQPDWKNYEVFMRPEIWYNGYDGIKTGIHFNGNYMNFKHRFNLTAWFNSGALQNILPEVDEYRFNPFSFSLNYRTPVYNFSRFSEVYLTAKYLDGLNLYAAGWEKWDRSNRNAINLWVKSMFRNSAGDLNYLLYPDLWNAGKLNNTVNVSFRHLYKYKWGNGNILLKLKSAAAGSDYNFSQIGMTAVNENKLGKIGVRTRTFVQYGTGRNPPPESGLYFAGANPEEMMDNKFVRSVGMVPYEWTGYGSSSNHFHHGGGMNMRGFAGYLVPAETGDGEIRFAYTGTAGAALNTEIILTGLIPYSPKGKGNGWNWKRPWWGYDIYLFGDGGVINYNYFYEKLSFAAPRIDAGLGIALSLNRWGPVENVAPLTLRFDMPFYLYPVPAVDTSDPYNPDYTPKWNEMLKFRWMIGVGRAF